MPSEAYVRTGSLSPFLQNDKPVSFLYLSHSGLEPAGFDPTSSPISAGRCSTGPKAHCSCADEAFVLSFSYNPLCVQSAGSLGSKPRSLDPSTCSIRNDISGETTTRGFMQLRTIQKRVGQLENALTHSGQRSTDGQDHHDLPALIRELSALTQHATQIEKRAFARGDDGTALAAMREACRIVAGTPES